MFKRVTWFTVGAAVGAGGTVVAYLRAREAARRHIPPTVADAAARATELAGAEARVRAAQARVMAAEARVRVDQWREAAADGQAVRQEAEARLRAELDRAGLY
jgi:hypothetical protein